MMDFDSTYLLRLVVLKLIVLIAMSAGASLNGIKMSANTKAVTTRGDNTIQNDHTLPASMIQKRSLNSHRTRWMFPRPPMVSVALENPEARQTGHSVRVPLSPDMTVIDALIASVQATGRADSPFNVNVSWDFAQQCYAVSKALSTYSTSEQQWIITVTNNDNEVVYRSPCVPLTAILWRNYNVSISYGNQHDV